MFITSHLKDLWKRLRMSMQKYIYEKYNVKMIHHYNLLI